jgi:hypothetical protein
LNNLESNDLHICTSKGSGDFETNNGVETSTVAVGDIVTIAIHDPDVADFIAAKCQVTLWTTEYTIDKIEVYHGSKMAYLSNGQPVAQPIDVDLLKRVNRNG